MQPNAIAVLLATIAEPLLRFVFNVLQEPIKMPSVLDFVNYVILVHTKMESGRLRAIHVHREHTAKLEVLCVFLVLKALTSRVLNQLNASIALQEHTKVNQEIPIAICVLSECTATLVRLYA